MREQGFQDEFDEIDEKAVHLVLYDDIPVATGRVYKGNKEGEFIIGRVAVATSYRGQHLGAMVMELLEDKVREYGGAIIGFSAQCKAQRFYKKLGFIAVGDIYLDEFCEHIHMEKILEGEKE